MTDNHDRLRPAEDEGSPDDRLLMVATLVHKLHEAPPQLAGFMGFIDAAGELLNRHGHRPGRMQSWLSHFALVLKYEGDERLWMLQRDTHGVDYYPINERVDAFTWEARVAYDESRPAAIVCNLATAENDWPTPRTWGDVVRRWNVWDRVQEERSKEYDLMSKNCQHCAYDFHKYTLEHACISKLGFAQYTEGCQERFVSQGGPWA